MIGSIIREPEWRIKKMSKFSGVEEAREFFQAERFAIENGCMIEEVEPGRSVCSMSLSDKHKNSFGMIMGGVVFTIANFAYSVAAYNDYGSEEPATVSINYLSTPKGDRLVAYAECADTMAKIILYNVSVRDSNGDEVAFVVFRGN